MSRFNQIAAFSWMTFISLLLAGTASAEKYPLRADARIDSRSTDQNFGGDAVMRLVINSISDHDGSIVRGLVSLDLPEIAATEIADARLWMALTRVF